MTKIILFLTFIFWLIALLFIEYFVHRLVMHHECAGPLKNTFNEHSVQHHRLGRVDINVDASALFYLLVISPILLGLVYLGWLGEFIISVLVICCYAWLWTGVHRAIHNVGGRWATYIPLYPFWKRHHLVHHAKPARNYGTLFGPLLDIPLGTFSKNKNFKERKENGKAE